MMLLACPLPLIMSHLLTQPGQVGSLQGSEVLEGYLARDWPRGPGLVEDVQVRPQEVQVQPKMSVPAQIIKNGPNRVQN